MASLTVIESNLFGEHGHYAAFVRALASCVPEGDRLTVMCDEALPDSVLADSPQVAIQRRFRTVGRQRDERRALRECLAAATPFLILTAHHTDVLRLEGAARATRIDPVHATLYFHWRESGFVERLAIAACTRVRHHARAVAPTEAIAAFLRDTGWRNVDCIPYPVKAVPRDTAACEFRHLLVAGSVRMNKGIDKVVDSLAHLASRSSPPALLVQTTGKRRGGVSGRAESRAVDALLASRYPGLRPDPQAPDPRSYARRFNGAITLTPYHPAQFAHNVSGVALDALLHGSPVVATRGTWQAALVTRFGAGRVMDAWTGRSLATAAMACIDDWDRVSSAAREAASVLAAEHHPNRLLDRLMGVT